MAISETISVDAGPAIAGLDALASAAEAAAAKFESAMSKLKVPPLGGAGADKLAASMEAAASKISASVAKIEEGFARLAGVGDKAAAGVGKFGDAADAAAGGVDKLAEANARLAETADASAGALDKQAVAGERAGKASAVGAASGTKFWDGLKVAVIGAGVAAAYGIDKAMKFQSQMMLLHTQAGVSMKDTQAISRGVLLISTQTGQSLSSVAESAYHVASNMTSVGGTVKQQLDVIRMAAEGAAVGHSDLVDTTNALTSVVASGIPGVKTYAQAMGMLNATVGSGDMTMQQLAESMASGLVPVVKGYGLNLQDVGAALATFGDLNIRGAHAGTYLRMAVQALSSPMSSAKVQMKELGLTTNTLSRDMLHGGLIKALDDLQGRFRKIGLTPADEGQIITQLFGKKAGAGLAVLLENMDRLHSKYPVLTADANNFNAAWAATQATPQQKWKELTAGFQAAAVSFGTEMLPAFTKAVGFADHILADLNGSKGAWKDIAIGAGGLAALFTGNKLASGVREAFATGEAGLRGIGKVLGLEKLANLGKSAGLDGAASALSGSASALDGAAASLDGAAAALKGESVPGGVPGGKAARAAETAAPAGLTVSSLVAGISRVIGPAMIAVAVDEAAKYLGAKAGTAIHAPRAPGGAVGSALYDTLQNAAMQVPVLAPTMNLLEGLFGIKPGARAGRPAAQAPVTQWVDVSAGMGEGGGRPAPTIGMAAGYGGPAPAAWPGRAATPATAGTAAAQSALAMLTTPPKPVKVPPPDLSPLTAAGARVQAAINALTGTPKPVKIPPPDLSALTAAEGPATAAGAAAGQGFASGLAGEAGAAAAAGAQVAAAAAGAMRAHLQTRSPSRVTHQIGSQTVQGFIEGLEGGQANLQAVMQALIGQLANPSAVQAIDQTIAQLKQEVAGDTGLVKWLGKEQGKLDSLANKQGALMAEISNAQQLATSAISGASIMSASGYTAAGSATGGPMSAQSLISGMQLQLADTKAFAAELRTLQKEGLNATSLSQIAQAGVTAGLPLAQGLAQGGKGAVQQINALEAQVIKASQQIGAVGGTAMYQAGLAVTAGLATGLKAALKQVTADMAKIARQIVAAMGGHPGGGSSAASGALGAAGLAAGSAAAGKDNLGSAASGAAQGLSGVASAAGGASSGLNQVAGAATAAAAAFGALIAAAGGGSGSGKPGGGPGGGGGGAQASGGPSVPGYHGISGWGTGGGTVHHHQTVHVHVAGTVAAEQDLVHAVQQGFLQMGSNNWQVGIITPGRHT